MEFYEFGEKDRPIIILLHAMGMNWTMWKPQIDSFARRYHVIAVALEGHEDKNRTTFTTVDENAKQIITYMQKAQYIDIFAICGLSLGGAVTVSILAKNELNVHKAIIDAGIVPIPVSKAAEFREVCSNCLFMWVAKHSKRLLLKVMKPEDYSMPQIDAFYNMIHTMSSKTAKNVFRSVDTYPLPDDLSNVKTEIVYWYGTKEEKDRKLAVVLLTSLFPNVKYRSFEGYNHAQLCIGNPKLWLKYAYDFLEGKKQN